MAVRKGHPNTDEKVAGRAEALAERTGNQVANFWACYHRTIAALEAADVPEMQRCAARTHALASIRASRVRWPGARYRS